jgi:putative ABC transport system permease protein
MEKFDLEKAIAEWKKNLYKSPGLEESHVIELEGGLREEIEELVSGGMGSAEAFGRAAAEAAPAEVLGGEFYKARTTRRSGRPPWQAPRFMPALLWHYLKIAGRMIKRRKSHTAINMGGLAVGMACFLLIMATVQFELSFDRFHEKADRLFRVAIRNNDPKFNEYSIATPEILSKTLRLRVPEVKHAGIAMRSRRAVFYRGKEAFTEDGFFADENFFDLFSFKWLRGHPTEALKAPNSIVLTETMAAKLFGSDDPIGKSLRYRSPFLACELTVAGLMRQPPKNSHLQFQYLVSMATMAADRNLREWFQDWDTAAFITYLELQHPRFRKDAEQKIAALLREARPQTYKREDAAYLQPLTDIHLKSRVERATATNNRIQSVSLYGAVALLVLIIAGINSMNLSTALAVTRAKEIGVRKVSGALCPQLIRQFLGESYLLTILAMGLSLLMFFLFFPVFAGFLGNGLTLDAVAKAPLALSILATILFVGAFSGIYPAFVLAAFQPFAALKKYAGNKPKGTKFRNLLVVFQFTAVVALLIGTIAVTRQLNFIRERNSGYDREHVVILPLKEDEAIKKAQVLKTRLLEAPGILCASVSDSTPLGLGMAIGGKEMERENGETFKIDYNLAAVDHDFLKVYGMTIVEGRNFSPAIASDGKAVIINEAFVHKTGWKKPLEMRLNHSPIIGVVKDFNYDTLQKEIEPAVISVGQAPMGGVSLGLRLRPGDPVRILAAIRKTFAQTVAGQPFDFYFLDDAFNQLYRNERSLAALIGYLEAVAIILGAMGLFGLATHATKQRTKEIGIRKVLGASVFSIIRMLSREFIVLVALANVAAWPIGYSFLRRWLQSYAYHCPLGIEIFVLAGLGTFLIALTAVGLHTIRAARLNPVESLRYE